MSDDTKLDKLFDQMVEVKVELAKVSVQTEENTKSLREHMEQTQLVREQTEILKNALMADKDALVAHNEQDIKMHEKFNSFINRTKWTGTIILSSCALVAFLYRAGWLQGMIAALYHWTNHS